MVKKSLAYILIFALVFSSFSFNKTVNAEGSYTIDGFTYTVEGNEITKITGNGTELTLPDTISGVKITSLSESAFYSLFNLVKLHIPAGIKVLDTAWYDIFSFNDNLIDLSIDENNPYYIIEDDIIFSKDKKIIYCYLPFKESSSYTVPNTVKKICDNAFRDNEYIEEAILGSGIESIGSSCFKDCHILHSVEFNSSIKEIPNNCFERCWALNSIKIPEGCVSFGNFAFKECNLDSVIFPSTLKSIGNECFRGALFSTIDLPAGLTSLGVGCFYGANLQSIEIPKGVETVPNECFALCTLLTNVEMKDGVKIIGERAFTDCYALQSIMLPDSVIDIGREAFSGCQKLKSVEIPDGVTEIKDNTFNGCSDLRNISIPSTIRSIEMFAFASCTSLENLEIPEGCLTIDRWVFTNCSSLKSITIPETVNCIYDPLLDDSNITATVNCVDGSYAFEYVKSKGYSYNLVDTGKKHQNILGVNDSYDIKPESSIEINAITDGDGIISYSTSDEGIATLINTDEGYFIYANNPGTVTITIEASPTVNYYKAEKKIIINVEKRHVHSSYITKVNEIEPTYTSEGFYLQEERCSTCGELIGTSSYKLNMLKLSKVTGVKSTLSSYNMVKVEWNKVKGASGYHVMYRKGTSGKWQVKNNTKGVFYNRLEDGKKYYFKVRAYARDDKGNIVNIGGESALKSCITLKKLDKPTVKSSSAKAANVSWSKCNGATGYQVCVTAKSNNKSIKGFTKKLSLKSKGLTKGNKYMYKVRAYKLVNGKKVFGPWSKVKTYKHK